MAHLLDLADLPVSLPSRERGLKCILGPGGRIAVEVAPFTGAWIEISQSIVPEILLPVAPFTGAWIEIGIAPWVGDTNARRSLHGSVD